MRLWHESLIPYLPRQQLLGQHREYRFCLRKDGWVGVIEMENGAYCPKIEAASVEKAEGYCNTVEPLNVPVSFL